MRLARKCAGGPFLPASLEWLLAAMDVDEQSAYVLQVHGVSHKASRNGEIIYRALVREVMVQQLLAMERTG
jgi:hypothetical protein